MELFSKGMGSELIPLLIVILPIVGALLTFIFRKNSVMRDLMAVSITVVIWLLSLMLIPVFKNGLVGISLDGFLVIGLTFKIDYFSLIFINLFTLVWMLATIYGSKYMAFEHGQTRFFVFLLLTYTGALGVVAAGDFFTLFLFFELMAFCSYVLVIHEENEKAMKAGHLYLYLGVIGGLALLLAIIFQYNHTGSMAFDSLLPLFEGNKGKLVTILLLYTLGFGLKAGMAPFHIWLPQAHPIAPSPASALLSGIMIKTGVYGLVRVFASTFNYTSEMSTFYNETIGQYGYWLIWAGIITMFLGAFLALFQQGAKNILAYSSVSQIGYIIMGIGCAAYLGSYGAMAMSGVIYHTINHALFKGALFLTVGAIYIYTHDLDITRVRGLAGKYPFLMLVFLVSAFGIAGVPGFNGYPSKSILHHAIVEAYEYNGLISLWWAEKIFTLTSALTICYFTKLFRGLFLGKMPEKFKELPDTPLVMKTVLTVFVSLMVFIGIFPHVSLKGVVLKGVSEFSYQPYSVGYVEKLNVFNSHDLLAIGITFIIAGVIYFIFEKFNLYNLQFPQWMSVEKVFYMPIAKGFMFICLGPSVVLDQSVNKMYHGTGQASMDVFKHIGDIENSIDKAYSKAGTISTSISEDAPDKKCVNNQRTFWERLSVNPEWNLKNLNFDSIIVVSLFTILLVILVFFSKGLL